MKEPRFLNISDKLHLVIVTYENSVIVSVDGPVQCISEPGVNAPMFVAMLSNLCAQALYNKPVLTLGDLPADIKAKILTPQDV